MKEEKHIAVERIKAFIDKYLDGDINRLPAFRLSKLRNDEEFGCPNRERYDNDDTEIMRARYVLIFSDVWPGLTMEALTNYRYRGDTMNTYNTMFGKPVYGGSMHPGLDKFNPDAALKEKMVDFRLNHYNRIGNMVVLPNIELGGTTINRNRGSNHTHDFFDRFLADFKAVLTGAPDFDSKLSDLVRANARYLDPFMSANGFHRLCSELYFDDYLDVDLNPEVKSKAFYFWMKDVSTDEYLEEANRYIDFSNSVIDNRGQKMLAAIKHQLSLLSN